MKRFLLARYIRRVQFLLFVSTSFIAISVYEIDEFYQSFLTRMSVTHTNYSCAQVARKSRCLLVTRGRNPARYRFTSLVSLSI